MAHLGLTLDTACSPSGVLGELERVGEVALVDMAMGEDDDDGGSGVGERCVCGGAEGVGRMEDSELAGQREERYQVG